MHAVFCSNGRFQVPQTYVARGESLGELLQDPTVAIPRFCRSTLSESRNLFHHSPSEGAGVDYSNHDNCSWVYTEGSTPVIHAHSAMFDEAQYRVLLRYGARRKDVSGVVVMTSDWMRAIESRHRRQRDQITFGQRLIYEPSLFAVNLWLYVDALSRIHNIEASELRVLRVHIEDLNSRPDFVETQLRRFLMSTLTLSPNIKVRGKAWTGGHSPPFGKTTLYKVSFSNLQAKIATSARELVSDKLSDFLGCARFWQR